jgi:MYXO-CTERM domain-containing protein
MEIEMKTSLVVCCALTLAAGANASISESFDSSGLPAGWSNVDVLQVGAPSSVFGWDTNDNIVADGNSRGNIATGDGLSIVADSDAVGFAGRGAYDIALVSPSFTVPAGATLDFEHLYRQLSTSSTTERARVEISTDGSVWDNLATYSSSQFGTFSNADPFTDQDAGAFESLDLAAYAGQTAQVRFRFTDTDFSAWNWYWQIDNIAVVPTPGAAGLIGLAGLAATRRRRA